MRGGVWAREVGAWARAGGGEGGRAAGGAWPPRRKWHQSISLGGCCNLHIAHTRGACGEQRPPPSARVTALAPPLAPRARLTAGLFVIVAPAPRVGVVVASVVNCRLPGANEWGSQGVDSPQAQVVAVGAAFGRCGEGAVFELGAPTTRRRPRQQGQGGTAAGRSRVSRPTPVPLDPYQTSGRGPIGVHVSGRGSPE